MRYNSLHDLISGSSSSRRYFLSLPVKMQLTLHKHNDYIHSAEELHQRAEAIKAYDRSVFLSGGKYQGF